MTASEALHHVLHLILRWVRREKRHNDRSAFVDSPTSVTTPLGQIGYKRNPTTFVNVSEGIARAKKREYAVRPCHRIDE